MKINILLVFTVLLFSCSNNTSEEATQDSTSENVNQSNLDQSEAEETVEALMPIDYETAQGHVLNDYKKNENYDGETYIIKFPKEDKKTFLVGDFDGDGMQNFMIGHNCVSNVVDCWSHIEVYEEQADKTFKKVAQSGPMSTISYDLKYNTKNKVISMIAGTEYKLRYDKKLDKYILIGVEGKYDGDENKEGAGTLSINFSTGKGIENSKKWDEEKQEFVALPTKNFEVPNTEISPFSLENFAFDETWMFTNVEELEKMVK